MFTLGWWSSLEKTTMSVSVSGSCWRGGGGRCRVRATRSPRRDESESWVRPGWWRLMATGVARPTRKTSGSTVDSLVPEARDNQKNTKTVESTAVTPRVPPVSENRAYWPSSFDRDLLFLPCRFRWDAQTSTRMERKPTVRLLLHHCVIQAPPDRFEWRYCSCLTGLQVPLFSEAAAAPSRAGLGYCPCCVLLRCVQEDLEYTVYQMLHLKRG